MKLKVVVFSDTHTSHKVVKLPECDICFFAGDLTGHGRKNEAESFIKWFNSQYQCLYKVFIAGNHDICFDKKYDLQTNANKWLPELFTRYQVNHRDNSLYYLENSGIELLGLKIWGSPVTSWFKGDEFCFNKHSGNEINAVWDMIPGDSDIVITHNPAAYILDYTFEYGNQYLGCNYLREKLETIKPKLHVCGHIHEGYGVIDKGDTVYVNGSICDSNNKVKNKPIELEIVIER